MAKVIYNKETGAVIITVKDEPSEHEEFDESGRQAIKPATFVPIDGQDEAHIEETVDEIKQKHGSRKLFYRNGKLESEEHVFSPRTPITDAIKERRGKSNKALSEPITLEELEQAEIENARARE